MEILGVKITLDFDNMSEFKRLMPIINDYLKEAERTPLRKEMAKINALKVNETKKQELMAKLDFQLVMDSYEFQMDINKKFIKDVTDSDEIITAVGDSISKTASVTKEIIDNFNKQVQLMTSR